MGMDFFWGDENILKLMAMEPGIVAHTCNSIYSGGRGKIITI
jgi:hypothetical protein